MTDTIDNGGAAFPGPKFTQSGYQNGQNMGMSLRDWFAGQPDITGSIELLGRDDCERLCGPAPDEGDMIAIFQWQTRVLATLRYIAADAMIAARKGASE